MLPTRSQSPATVLARLFLVISPAIRPSSSLRFPPSSHADRLFPGATLDAVYYATRLLEALHNNYRRAILLISETRDHGSHSTPQEVIAALGRTNTVVDSVAYSPARDQVIHDLRYGGGSRNIIPWFMTAVNAVRKNAPSELAMLSGGEYANFVTQDGFELALSNIANHINIHYELSFPPPTTPVTAFTRSS